MTLCPQCQGSGDNVQGSTGQMANGTDVDPMFNGPGVYVPPPYSCTGCGGTGIYRNFGV